MTGPEHYRRAETELLNAEGATAADDGSASYYLAAAQVHATLALAAATADHALTSASAAAMPPSRTDRAWSEVIT